MCMTSGPRGPPVANRDQLRQPQANYARIQGDRRPGWRGMGRPGLPRLGNPAGERERVSLIELTPPKVRLARFELAACKTLASTFGVVLNRPSPPRPSLLNPPQDRTYSMVRRCVNQSQVWPPALRTNNGLKLLRCSISWGSSRDRALVGNIRGAFGESQSIRFGKGC